MTKAQGKCTSRLQMQGGNVTPEVKGILKVHETPTINTVPTQSIVTGVTVDQRSWLNIASLGNNWYIMVGLHITLIV